MFKNSKIISIEPTVYAFSKLKKNVSLNPNLKKRIEVHSSWNFLNNDKKHKIHLGKKKHH